MELDLEKRKLLITPTHANLSVRQQCELLSVNRSSLYYKEEEESSYNLLLMNLIDEEYTRHPFIGIIKMTKYLEDLVLDDKLQLIELVCDSCRDDGYNVDYTMSVIKK